MEHIIQRQWQEVDNTLYKAIVFKDFQEAFAFMVRVAFIAEKKNHHPRWCNEYNKIEIWLTTHDAGNIITKKDHDLAKEIDGILHVDLINP